MFSKDGDLQLKKALDASIYPDVKTYHAELPNVKNMPKEFCVYSVSSMSSQEYCDDRLEGGNDKIILRYYHAKGMKLPSVRNRESQILNALLDADFQCPTGAFELGDIDDIGYEVTGYELNLFSWS